MRKQLDTKRTGTSATKTATGVSLSEASFEKLTASQKKKYVNNSAHALLVALRWLDSKTSTDPDPQVEAVSEQVDSLASMLATSPHGMRLLHLLMSERGRKAMERLTPKERTALAKAAYAKVPDAERTKYSSRGGKAASEKLTPEERSEKARKAAKARWSRETPKKSK